MVRDVGAYDCYEDYAMDAAWDSHLHDLEADRMAPIHDGAEWVESTIEALPDNRTTRRLSRRARSAAEDMYVHAGYEGPWTEPDCEAVPAAQREVRRLLLLSCDRAYRRRQRRLECIERRPSVGVTPNGQRPRFARLAAPISIARSPHLTHAPPLQLAAPSAGGREAA